MRKTIALLLAAVMVLSLAACSQKPNLETLDEAQEKDMIESAEEYRDRLETEENLEPSEKRLLYVAESPAIVILNPQENNTHQIEFPFPAQDVTYSSDDDQIARVSDAGLITAAGNGTTLVHALVDGMMFHTTVTVENSQTLSVGDAYANFALDTFDGEKAAEELIRYASVTYGMGNVSGIMDNDHFIRTDSFTWDNHYDGCTVKRKLMSTIDYMSDSKYEKVSLEFVFSDNELACNFYGVRE